MTTESFSVQERALRQTLRLVDLACDLTRNASDGVHAGQANNEIVPVLDENIFEMFIRPFHYRESAATFYADVWSLSGRSDPDWKSFEAQAALLTSEYLISVLCKDRIYMTEFHRWELVHRLTRLQEELGDAATNRQSLYHDELGRKLRIFGSLFGPRASSESPPADMTDIPFLETDLQSLRGEGGIDQRVLDRQRAARTATHALADFEIAEPLDQLRRVVSYPIRPRIRTLQKDFKPSPAELIEIDREAEKWFGRLAKELARPGHQKRTRARKANEAARVLWNDARSVAYLRWVIKRKLKTHQRLVFITGDLVLFDTYRRWYFEIDEKSEDNVEPFFMRRVAQYTPLFNPSDGGGDLTGTLGEDTTSKDLFSLLERAVEAALVVLQDVWQDEEEEPASPESITSKRRESLALKQIDRVTLFDDKQLRPLAAKFSEGWVDRSIDAIHRNSELWQRLERFSIGWSYELVAARLDEEQRATAERYVSTPGEDTSRILSDYASRVLNELVENSMHLWLPLAESFYKEEFRDPAWNRPPIKRLSMAMNLPELQRMVAIGDGSSQPRPEIVFALATLKALDLQDINNAHRFAGMAIRADSAVEARSAAASGMNLELKYLNAVTNKMLILTAGAHVNPQLGIADERKLAAARSIDDVRNAFGRASDLINECLAAHYPHRDTNDHHAVRYLRALSERASLHLFMSTSLGLGYRKYPGLIDESPIEYLTTARGDLKLCIEIDSTIDIEDPVLSAVRNQFRPNIAGYEVLAFLLRGPENYVESQWSRRALKQLWMYWENDKFPHPLLLAELVGYAWLTGRPPPRGADFDRITNKKGIHNLRLPLDRALLKAIHREILNDYESNNHKLHA